MTIKKAGAGATLIKGPQREERCDNKKSGRKGNTDQMPAAGGKNSPMTKAVAAAILIKGPQREEKRDNKGSADAGALLVKGPQREDTCDNKECGRRSYTNQGPAAGGERDNKKRGLGLY